MQTIILLTLDSSSTLAYVGPTLDIPAYFTPWLTAGNCVLPSKRLKYHHNNEGVLTGNEKEETGAPICCQYCLRSRGIYVLKTVFKTPRNVIQNEQTQH